MSDQETVNRARTAYDKALEEFETASERLYVARRKYDDAYDAFWKARGITTLGAADSAGESNGTA